MGTVTVCGSVAHVIDAVLLPASFCSDSARTEVGEDEDEHDGDDDHDHDHDGEDHDDDKDGDLESLLYPSLEDDAGADDAAPENPADAVPVEVVEDDLEDLEEGGDEEGESIDEE